MMIQPQVEGSVHEMKRKLKAAKKEDPDHIVPGEQGGFETVVGILDNMVTLSKEEQASHDKHKEWCDAEFSTAEAEQSKMQDKVDDTEAFMQELKDFKAEIDSGAVPKVNT